MTALATGTRRRTLPQPFAVFSVAAAAAILFLLVFPFGAMLSRLALDTGEYGLAKGLTVFGEGWFVTVVANTALVVGLSTAIAVATGALLAWVNERTDASLGAVGSMLSIIPLVIPHVALTIGWVFIAAPRVGFVNGLLGVLPGGLQVNIYSWSGLILLYALNGVPYVYLIVSAALRNFDPALEEASRISGAGLWRTLWRITLPAIQPALVASAFLVAIAGIGLYSVPAVIATTARIDMLTTRMVQLLNRDFPPHLAEAQVLGIVILAGVGVLWYLQHRALRKGQFLTVGGRASGMARLPLDRWKWPARLFTLSFLLSTSVLPLAALLVVSFQRYWTPRVDLAQLSLRNFTQVLFVDRMAPAAFVNSLTLSTLGATIAMIIAIVLAVHRGRVSAVTDAVVQSSAAMPGVILALAFLVTFSGAPFYLGGTVWILLIAFVVMYIPSGSIAATSAVAQVGRDLREASYTSGAGESRTVARIIVPLALPGFASGWAIVFVHMMGDLSAAALLAGLRNPVIGFAVLAIWETGTFGVLAALSVMMCVVNVTIITIILGLGRMASRR